MPQRAGCRTAPNKDPYSTIYHVMQATKRCFVSFQLYDKRGEGIWLCIQNLIVLLLLLTSPWRLLSLFWLKWTAHCGLKWQSGELHSARTISVRVRISFVWSIGSKDNIALSHLVSSRIVERNILALFAFLCTVLHRIVVVYRRVKVVCIKTISITSWVIATYINLLKRLGYHHLTPCN